MLNAPAPSPTHGQARSNQAQLICFIRDKRISYARDGTFDVSRTMLGPMRDFCRLIGGMLVDLFKALFAYDAKGGGPTGLRRLIDDTFPGIPEVP
jgi:hypothetical protein